MPLPSHITLQIVTPDRPIVQAQVDEVEIPAVDGYMGVLPGHTPLLATLAVGQLSYRQGLERHYLAVAFGFAEIQPDRVTILAQIVEKGEEIDLVRADSARQRAEQRLARPTVEIDFERARIALMKSLIRQQVASRTRTRA